MRIISEAVPGVSRRARLRELSKKARQRLKWLDYYNCRGHNARLTCRYSGINPQTLYRWKRRNNPKHIANLEDCSHRPRQLKKPIYSTELVEVVLRLREDIPLEESCEVTENSFNLSELKDELLEWEEVYNTVRPHQALGYVIPLKFLEQWKEC